MHTLSMIFRIIAVLSAVAASILYFLIESKVEETEERLSRTQAELQTLVDKNEIANIEIAEFKEKLTAETQLVEEAEAKVEESKAELAAEKQESQRLQEELTKVRRNASQLQETTTRLRKELISAEHTAAAASQESVIAQLSEQIKELTMANTALEDKIQTLESSAKDTAPLKVDNAEDADQFTQKLTPDEIDAIKEETTIASISRTSGIIVFNADPKLNLTPGTVIKLIKNPEAIAQVKLINVDGPLAIANILPGAKPDDLSKGDTVKILR